MCVRARCVVVAAALGAAALPGASMAQDDAIAAGTDPNAGSAGVSTPNLPALATGGAPADLRGDTALDDVMASPLPLRDEVPLLNQSGRLSPSPLPANHTAAEVDAMAQILAPMVSTQRTQIMRVRSGDTVERVLIRAGAPRAEAGLAIAAMGGLYDARSLRAGQSITVFMGDGPDGVVLAGLSIESDPTRSVQVSRTAAGVFVGRALDVPVTTRLAVAQGVVETSLYVDALDAGASPQIVADIANLLAYSVDFQREIYPGDPFEILFEEMVTPDGRQVGTGDFLYVRFEPQQRRNLEYWRFEGANGQVGFYGSTGESAKRFLMKTPINGARLSSSFGPRRHPVLGYNRMHKGTDFAARTGTPIYAAGDGVVERANRFGSYGNYILIRHANGYKTAYAHLNGFARNIRAGRRVTQGQVIGYVGATGRVTGPHLHYEVLRNGVHINPMSMRAPTGRTLDGDELDGFLVEREIIDQMRRAAGGGPARQDDGGTGPASLAARSAPGPDGRS